MAFLDNSGDIILDAVLTDTGRMRLAKGDGSFNIVKFALGDDEINYELYDKNHASGSAYYDIEILQSPVLEAFTNNTSTLKSKLLSISRTNLLYLPEIKFDSSEAKGALAGTATTNNILSVAVDETTVKSLENISKNLISGVIDGNDLTNMQGSSINFDQGIAGEGLGASGANNPLEADLIETQYIIEIDDRLGYLVDPDGNQATPSFIDDDNIASYYLSVTTNANYFSNGLITTSAVLDGPLGYKLSFLIGPSLNLQGSTYLFTQLGSTSQIDTGDGDGDQDLYHIDTTVRVTGATTGYRVDLPIRFLKKQ
mgnify:CR=1 FL=1